MFAVPSLIAATTLAPTADFSKVNSLLNECTSEVIREVSYDKVNSGRCLS